MSSPTTFSRRRRLGRVTRTQIVLTVLAAGCQSRSSPLPGAGSRSPELVADARPRSSGPSSDDRHARSPRVEGTVRRSDGAPAAGAVVAVVPEMGRRAAAVTVADRRGRFQAEVPAGRYAITATADGSTAGYREPTAIASGGRLAV